MRAIVYRRYGSPDVIGMEDVERPIPADNEVLVKVRAVSINSWDWDFLTGKPVEYRAMSGLIKPKSILLHGCDIAGEVEAIGKNVTQYRVGDEVFGDLAEGGWGAFAEYTCAPENYLTLKPSDMTFEQAACLSHGGNLAVQGLIDFGHVQSGQKVLINGGGGSTGTLAIQIAKLFDAEVTAVDRSEKFEMMTTLGADHLIDYRQADFTRDGHHYDLVFDVKTDRSVFDYARSLNPGGTYVTVGGKTSRILQLVMLKKFFRNKKLHLVGYKPNKDSGYLNELFQTGNLKPVIDKCYPLEKTKDAFRYFGEGCFKGKIVVAV